jgi:hypothetical protein
MASAVGYLLNSPAAAARMAVRAQAQLGERYGIAALRAALTAAYRADLHVGSDTTLNHPFS